METFKYGDTVTHKLHGRGRVHNVYPMSPLVQVFFDGATNDPYGMMLHPVSLTKVAVPRFEARIVWTDGAVTVSVPLNKRDLRQYMSRLDEERMDRIEITRIKSSKERTADYLKSMAAEDDAVTNNA